MNYLNERISPRSLPAVLVVWLVGFVGWFVHLNN